MERFLKISAGINKLVSINLVNMFRFFLGIFLFFVSFNHSAGQNVNINERKWKIGSPVFEKGQSGAFDETSVKDPSIVYYDNTWHLFYTARGNGEYTTGYVSAADLESLNTAPRQELKQIRGKTRYGCAPQVFYFEPQKQWYLVFQNRDSNYQPAFSTNKILADPESWGEAQPLIQKDVADKWIDFWVIADESKAYLFYTEAHKGVMVRSTDLDDFPGDWSLSEKIFDGVHEAVHIYRAVGRNEFHMIYELNNDGIRSYGLAMASHLAGPWEKVTDRYATGEQLVNPGESGQWTEMVSHGEVIRAGFNQSLEYHPDSCRWIIQGIMKNELTEDYPSLPWKLGVIKKNTH